MKIQHLAVIFIIIIMPIVMTLATYVGNLIDVSNKQAKYDAVLLNATYDAVRAHQMATLNNTFASINASRMRDLNATVNSFFNSLATGLSSTGYRKEQLYDYVPAMLITLYDGYYVYGPFENYAQINNGKLNYIKEPSATNKPSQEYGLKPFVNYTCQYKEGDNYNIIINYTLDNYISVAGTYKEGGNQKYITASGYYIDPNSVTIVDDTKEVKLYSGTTNEVVLKPEVLTEWLSAYNRLPIGTNYDGSKNYDDGNSYIAKYQYVEMNGEKYYLDTAIHLDEMKTDQSYQEYPIFKLDGNLKVYINNDSAERLANYIGTSKEELKKQNPSDFTDKNYYWYYKNAKEFSENVYKVLQQIDLSNNVVVTNSYKRNYNISTTNYEAGNMSSHIKSDYTTKKVFDYNVSGNNPELDSSSFNQHRMDVIITSIEDSLANSIANFNKYHSLAYDYRMPTISETDWDKIANNVNIVSFLQGMVVGNFKYYNNYALVSNTKNKEFISKEAIRVQEVNPGTNLASNYQNYSANFHLPTCKIFHNETHNPDTTVGYRMIDYEIQSYENKGPKNYYLQAGTGDYQCVISNNQPTWTYDELMTGNKNDPSDTTNKLNNEVRRAYITALAREKANTYQKLDNLNEKVEVTITDTPQAELPAIAKPNIIGDPPNEINGVKNWTNGEVIVTASTETEGYTLKIKNYNNSNWEETNGTSISCIVDQNNKTVKAKLFLNGHSGEEVEYEVTNIDKTPPTDVAPTLTKTGDNSITISSNQTDNQSGINKEKQQWRITDQNGMSGDWQSFENSQNLEEITVEQGKTYYIQTSATDNVGNYTESQVNSILISATTPEPQETTGVYGFLYDNDGNGKGETLVLASQKNITYNKGTKIKEYGEYTSVPYSDISLIVKAEIFDEIHPTTTECWFQFLSNLVSIQNINNIKTDNVTSMHCMFRWCEKLKSIDVSEFNTQNVISMGSMFESCFNLSSIDVSRFDTRNVISMYSMFYGCSQLESLNVSGFNTEKVKDFSRMFAGCGALKSIDLSKFNTSNAIDMSEMLFGCKGLTTIDIGGFNTNNVTDMHGLFNGCSNLLEIDLKNFNTSNVTNMSGMFESCAKLNELDLSSFNTSSLELMKYMFTDCIELVSLNIRNFNTSNVVSMEYTFAGCLKLTKLDVSQFNTSKVYNMRRMFGGCRSLSSLDVSKFNTSNVENMGAMFSNCSQLKELDLTNFNTKKVTNMSSMFTFLSLEKMDLSSFDTKNVTDMSRMFYANHNLKTIFVSKNFITNNVKEDDDMFSGCYNIVGGRETKYNAYKVDKTYARIDGGADNPGYFTQK